MLSCGVRVVEMVGKGLQCKNIVLPVKLVKEFHDDTMCYLYNGDRYIWEAVFIFKQVRNIHAVSSGH